MAGFSRTERQRIIDGYLAASGKNLFVPAEFIDWLSGQPDHDAYDLFFGQGDEQAAREHRVALARSMASGLRITARVQDVAAPKTEVRLTVREFPALVSPIEGRKQGGGYVTFDPTDPMLVHELRRQAAQALRAWLARYRGVAELGGLDLGSIEEIAVALDRLGVVEADAASSGRG